ncbi:MAG TPA: low molecular weight protein arginine phosphatase [Longimicrobium sp.]|nr:low molecular weight protein arginine phosphatase [Longimicrobium sp.]
MLDDEGASAPGAEMSEEATPQSPPTTTFNILFVCTGNTCRSPLAEGIARRELERRGWSHVRVASAGVAAPRGEAAAAPAVSVARGHGIDLGQHRTQPVTPGLLDWADLVLAMGPNHLFGLDRMGEAEKNSTLGDFVAGGEGLGPSVSDPYGSDEAVYEVTYRELEGLVAAALDRLEPILHP